MPYTHCFKAKWDGMNDRDKNGSMLKKEEWKQRMEGNKEEWNKRKKQRKK